MIQENIALTRKILHESRNKTVNIIIIIHIRLFHSIYITKIKDIAISALWRRFGIMTVHFFYNIVRIRVLLPDNIKYTDLLLRQKA